MGRVIVGSFDLAQRREFLSRPSENGREGRKREWVKVDAGVETFIVPFSNFFDRD